MKVHLGEFHTRGPKGCSLLSSMVGTNITVLGRLGAELQVLQGFKVDTFNIKIYICTSQRCRFGHHQPYVYSITSKPKLNPLTLAQYE